MLPDEGLSPIEHRLRGWAPDPAGLDRDRLLFEAGRASVSRSASWWPIVVVAGLALVPTLGWWSEHDRRLRAERVLAAQETLDQESTPSVAPPPSIVAEVRPLDPSSYLALSRRPGEFGDSPASDRDATTPGANRGAESGPILTPRTGEASRLF